MKLSEWDHLASIIDPLPFDCGRDEFCVDMAERRNAAREKVRLLEIAMVKLGWHTPADIRSSLPPAPSPGRGGEGT